MDRTFGVEIEAYNLTPAQAAAAIDAAGITCRQEHYGHATPTNWKVVTDQSLRGARLVRADNPSYGYSDTFEVVSPILRGEDGYRQVRTVMAALTAAGAKVNKSCGLHVHIGAGDLTVAEVRNVAKNYVLFEDFFDAIMPLSRRACNNIFVMSNRKAAGGDYSNHASYRVMAKLDSCNTIDEIIRVVCPGADHSGRGRYHKLNLVAMWVHGTIEFRQHAGTTDGEKAVKWIQLLMQFVNRAAQTRQRQPKVIAETSPLSRTFHNFFRTFKIADKAYFTARRDSLHAVAALETAFGPGEGPRVTNTMRRLAAR